MGDGTTRIDSPLARAHTRADAAGTTGSTSADEAAFLHDRVTRFLLALFALLIGAYVAGVVLVAALGLGFWRVHTSVPKLIHLLMVAVLGVGWRIARASKNARLHRLLDVVATTLVAAALSVAALFAHELVPSPFMMNIIISVSSLVLVLRAALVPGTARRAVVVGLFVTVATVLTGALTFRSESGDPHQDLLLGATLPLISGLLFTVGSAIVARTVYGLRRSVREAMQLGQYTLQRKIGEGGMGAVYLARHALLRRPTAVKLLPADKAGATAVARFEREVQLTAQLTHPNTVSIFDFGHTADGVFYYAMEYLEGLSLDELVAVGGPQPASRVAHILLQVAGALGEAHDVGLIHRDIKPANILLCERGGLADVAKVVDFGLVKPIENGADSDLTAANLVAGTPAYLAPESLADPDAVDGRADLYALGAVGYFLLTGAQVFVGKTTVEVCGHHLHTVPTPPSERLGAEVPEALERVILCCLAKTPAERYATAGDLQDALLACDCGSWSQSDAKQWWSDHAGAIADLRKTVTDASVRRDLTVALGGRQRP